MNIDIDKLFEEGSEVLQQEHAVLEETKVGTLRAGNTGIVQEDGQVVGKCPRQTYLRMNGISFEEVDSSKRLMFDAGITNETSWLGVLSKAWKGEILCEEETPISWETSNGVRVTGRPDIVLAQEGEKKLGLELKLACSLWTVRDCLNNKPKPSHVMQAAHYAWKLDIPFELWYTSRVNYAIPKWAINMKLFPLQGESGSEHIDYAKDGKAKNTKPMRRGYKIRLDKDGLVHYAPIGKDSTGYEYPERPTIVSTASIGRYYELVANADTTGDLGKPPDTLAVDGSKMNFSAKDYCPLGELCCFNSPNMPLDELKEKASKLHANHKEK